MDTTTFIAVTTVLSALLCIFIITTFRLFVLHHRRNGTPSPSSTDAEAVPRPQPNIRFVPRKAPFDGWDEDAVKYSYVGFNAEIYKFIHKWMLDEDDSAVPGDDSPSRIEGTLFIDGPAQDSLDEGRDTRPFLNEREYTPEEICSLLQNENTRTCIAHHIFASVLLKAVSLDGSPLASLLPFSSIDLRGLRRLREALRGVPLSPAVTIHAHDFGAYHAFGPDFTMENQEKYLNFFESVFEPYLKGDTYEDKIDRRGDLRAVLAAADDHGIKVIGCPNHDFQYKWGERDVRRILSYPGLWASIYTSGRLVRNAKLIEARNDSVKRGTEG